MTRKERRANDPNIQAKRLELNSGESGNILGFPPGTQGITGRNDGGGGGWATGDKGSKPAGGQAPQVNPFVIPKSSGLSRTTQTFPSGYFREWNLAVWRSACDQVLNSGYPVLYATMVSWVFECSPFVQGLFEKLGAAVDRIKFNVVDSEGNKLDDWTEELCDNPWSMQLRKEFMFSFFWGFSGLNFDPATKKIYKYPLQQIDPLNRMLRSSTFAFYDGTTFDDTDNLIFVQPSTSYESFLGWMQPISRSFIQMNQGKNNWLAAGRRLAFPILTVGYPQNDGAIDAAGNSVNPYKNQAEVIAATTDPQNGVVYPYTLDSKGDVVKSINIEFEATGTKGDMHKIYQEFNNDEKNEIREMIFGATLTGNTDGKGSYALGEVHEDMYDAVVDGKIAFILAELNASFMPKIARFYKNFPKNVKFTVDRTKKLTIEEMQALSTVVTQNGKQLTNEFFEANGVNREFIEDAAPVKDNIKVEKDSATLAVKKKLLIGSEYVNLPIRH